MLTITPLIARAAGSEDERLALDRLEAVIGQKLSAQDRADLHEQMQTLAQAILSFPQPSTGGASTAVLLCARAEAQLYVGSSLAGCVDLALRPYYLISAGAGFGAGLTLSAFSLIYRSPSGMPVDGVYYGAKIGGALGPWGGSVGIYFRGDGQGHAPAEDAGTDKIYWLGYNIGASFDLSAAFLHIGRL
jgi:hypothetical protein